MTQGIREIIKPDEARDAILASIRRSLAASVPFDADHQKHHGHSVSVAAEWSPVRASVSRDGLIENFRSNLQSVGGHCKVVSSESEAAEHIRTLVERLSAVRIAISDSEIVRRVVEPGDGLEIVKNASTDFLFECDLGITGAQWAIAETGTLVLESDAESHRLTSLVPPVHICVLRADRICQTLGEILELASPDANRVITFITGASRTSDIELTLVIGVHGPRELHVIVIADQ